jgi:hypothetical protein
MQAELHEARTRRITSARCRHSAAGGPFGRRRPQRPHVALWRRWLDPPRVEGTNSGRGALGMPFKAPPFSGPTKPHVAPAAAPQAPGGGGRRPSTPWASRPRLENKARPSPCPGIPRQHNKTQHTHTNTRTRTRKRTHTPNATTAGRHGSRPRRGRRRRPRRRRACGRSDSCGQRRGPPGATEIGAARAPRRRPRSRTRAARPLVRRGQPSPCAARGRCRDRVPAQRRCLARRPSAAALFHRRRRHQALAKDCKLGRENAALLGAPGRRELTASPSRGPIQLACPAQTRHQLHRPVPPLL